MSAKSRKPYRCHHCGEVGHNLRTCPLGTWTARKASKAPISRRGPPPIPIPFPCLERLGVESDSAIARDVGVSAPTVRRWRLANGIVTRHHGGARPDPGSRVYRAVEILRASDGPMCNQDIAKAAGIPDAQSSRSLAYLARRGLVVRVRYGWWAAAPETKPSPEPAVEA